MQKRIVVWTVLVFCTLLSQNAWAKTDLGMRSLGVDAGFVDPSNVDGTFGFGAFANMGNLSQDVRLQPHIGYWSKSQEFGGAKASVSDIAFSTRALYMFHGTSPKFRPYAGGGVGVHFVKAKAETTFPPPGMSATDTSTKLGLDMGGGFTTPLSEKADFCVDMWYTAMSDVGHFSLKAGVSFDLGHSSDTATPKSTHRSRARR